jgi:hypothetical protein
MAAKTKLKRYELRYLISHPNYDEGELRKWWTDEHVQEERDVWYAAGPEHAWYLLLLHHDTWQKLPPRINRISASRRRGRKRGAPTLPERRATSSRRR